MKRYPVVFLFAALLAGCADEVQVHQHIGSVMTGAESPTSADVSIVDRGRWTLFQLVDNKPAGNWPLPFRVDLLDQDGRLLISRTIDATTSQAETSGKGHRLLTWGFDELRGSFGSNLNQHGDLPIDRVLREGQRHTLRFTFSPQPTAHRYEVVLLANRKLYPWQR